MTHDRIRQDHIDKSGKITLRNGGTLYSIGIGRTHARTRVIVLVQDLDIRIIDAATGELLRELVLDPTQRYQPIPRPDTSRLKPGTAEPRECGFGRPGCLETSHGRADRI